MTDQRNWKAILEDAKARGIHRAQLARELGAYPSQVSTQCFAHDIDLPRAPRGQKPRYDWAKVLHAAVKAGKTLGDVSRETRVSKPAICKHAQKLGVKLRDPRGTNGGRIAA